MGKGSGRRPGDGFEANHERIFGKRERQQWTPPPLPDQTQIPVPRVGGDDNEIKDEAAYEIG